MDRTLHEKPGVRSPAARAGREGTTLVELLMAVVIISFMAGAIYVGGLAVFAHTQSVTITTAANTYAKEGLEEIIAVGYDTLTGGEPIEQVILMNPNTHKVNLTRTTQVVWHAPDGSISDIPLEDGYAEVIVQVAWQVPRTSHTASSVISALLY